MSAKRPERKESGEWAKHLRPKRKRTFWKSKRRADKVLIKGETMADKLTELFNEAQKANPDVSDFVSFQAGFSMSAVSMRARAMAVVDKNKDVNKIKNGIGSLPDIPA